MGRFSQGKRGLKSKWLNSQNQRLASLLAREAWIEIMIKLIHIKQHKSHLAREAGIEIKKYKNKFNNL